MLEIQCALKSTQLRLGNDANPARVFHPRDLCSERNVFTPTETTAPVRVTPGNGQWLQG